MRLAFLILLGLSLYTGIAAQDKDPCDDEILLKTSRKFTRLYASDIREYFRSFDEDCSEKSQFRDWRNEMLFEILGEYPEHTIRILSVKHSGIKMKNVMDAFHTTDVSQLNLEALIKRVEAAKVNKPIKEEILQILHSSRARH